MRFTIVYVWLNIYLNKVYIIIIIITIINPAGHNFHIFESRTSYIYISIGQIRSASCFYISATDQHLYFTIMSSLLWIQQVVPDHYDSLHLIAAVKIFSIFRSDLQKIVKPCVSTKYAMVAVIFLTKKMDDYVILETHTNYVLIVFWLAQQANNYVLGMLAIRD